MVFCKKKYPDLWEKKVLEGARKYILYDEEWGDKKVLDKIKSWRKPTAGHLVIKTQLETLYQIRMCKETVWLYV